MALSDIKFLFTLCERDKPDDGLVKKPKLVAILHN
jgi:hypothetical protein